MNIFSSLRVYTGKWAVKDSRDFAQEEIDAVDSAHVVDSQYRYLLSFLNVNHYDTISTSKTRHQV